ncbi:unnamed protein product [Ectocarpus fasciculatus]
MPYTAIRRTMKKRQLGAISHEGRHARHCRAGGGGCPRECPQPWRETTTGYPPTQPTDTGGESSFSHKRDPKQGTAIKRTDNMDCRRFTDYGLEGRVYICFKRGLEYWQREKKFSRLSQCRQSR